MADKDDDKSEDKPAVTFKTEADFLHAVKKKAAPEIKAAAEKAVADVLGRLGLENVEGLDEIKVKLDKSEGAKSEVEQLKAALAKADKEHRSLTKRNESLEGFRTSSIKQQAVLAHSAKMRDPETVLKLLASDLVVSDDGSVGTADGKSVDDAVEALLSAKDYLRAPGFTPGAGTSSKPAKSTGQSASQRPTNGEKPLTMDERRENFRNALANLANDTAGNHP